MRLDIDSLNRTKTNESVNPRNTKIITKRDLLGADLLLGTETSSITENIGVSLFNFILLLLYSEAKLIKIFF
jgi:hypothetical protein